LADAGLADACAETGADLILMHSRGSMTTMSGFSEYDALGYEDIVFDISKEWRAAEARANECGVPSEKIWFDPGLGFHKNADHCAEVMRRLNEFQNLGAGIVLGASRKSFLGSLDGSPPERRLGGSIAACLHGLSCGVSVLRVHDVLQARQALLAVRSWQPKDSGSPVLCA
jgi:dihydropteroate synthase